METLVLASRNGKKLIELRERLKDLGITVQSVENFPRAPEVEETGATFRENAALKAEAIRDATGLPALADDSGICVDALDGAPGVRSARFAGERASDEQNNRLLLEKLADVPDGERTGRFACCLALAAPGEETIYFDGTVEGTILHKPRGEEGFGYDPVFYSPELGKAFAEGTRDEKNEVSHRGRALRKLRAYLSGSDPSERKQS
jgi:XTP/dITP diphosphohydrolase